MLKQIIFKEDGLTKEETIRYHRLLWSTIAYLEEMHMCGGLEECIVLEKNRTIEIANIIPQMADKEVAIRYLVRHKRISKDVSVSVLSDGSMCFLCMYTQQNRRSIIDCDDCLSTWGVSNYKYINSNIMSKCLMPGTLYRKWDSSTDSIERSRLARQISVMSLG